MRGEGGSPAFGSAAFALPRTRRGSQAPVTRPRVATSSDNSTAVLGRAHAGRKLAPAFGRRSTRLVPSPVLPRQLWLRMTNVLGVSCAAGPAGRSRSGAAVAANDVQRTEWRVATAVTPPRWRRRQAARLPGGRRAASASHQSWAVRTNDAARLGHRTNRAATGPATAVSSTYAAAREFTLGRSASFYLTPRGSSDCSQRVDSAIR